MALAGGVRGLALLWLREGRSAFRDRGGSVGGWRRGLLGETGVGWPLQNVTNTARPAFW